MDLRQLPRNSLLWTALNTYRTSDQTKALKSEKFRTLSADDFQTSQVLPLAIICLKKIADNYKGRLINLEVSPIQLRTFYDSIDVDLPLENCINIDEEYYWKRVCSKKCSSEILPKEKTKNYTCSFWKKLGVTYKLAELIESTPYEIWNHEEAQKITKLVSAYVTDLRVNKLQPMRDASFQMEQDPMGSERSSIFEEKNRDGIEAEYDYPIQDCHHVDLSIIKNLTYMHSLTLEFLPPELGMHYRSRYFNFSYVDMQNLANGISELKNLKVFKLRRSRMDCTKLSTILEALTSIFVCHLEFYFCQLDDVCGQPLYKFLLSTPHLKIFNLSGNYFKDSGVVFISDGITKSPSQLTHFDISHNPISDEGLGNLTKALLYCERLLHVALSGIKTSKSGASYLADLVKLHPSLEELETIAVPLDGCTLIAALESNKKIQKVVCRGSGLSLEEDFKIDLLLKRNRYISENPYIGDATRTEQEINDFVTRIKNPILLHAMDTIKKWKDCRRKRDMEQHLSAAESGSSIRTKQFCYESIQFTEQDLDQRVSLYGQSKTKFFKKQGPCQVNQ